MIETIGWIGGCLLAFCGIPQAWQAYKNKHADGIDWYFLWMWFLGEIFVMIYSLALPKIPWPVIFNLATNIVTLLPIFYYKTLAEQRRSRARNQSVRQPQGKPNQQP